jgi:hypothetical protein
MVTPRTHCPHRLKDKRGKGNNSFTKAAGASATTRCHLEPVLLSLEPGTQISTDDTGTQKTLSLLVIGPEQQNTVLMGIREYSLLPLQLEIYPLRNPRAYIFPYIEAPKNLK